jgi:hypothetical protein
MIEVYSAYFISTAHNYNKTKAYSYGPKEKYKLIY